MHESGGLVLAVRVLGPAGSQKTGFVQVDVLNCDRASRTIYWPSQRGNLRWALEDVSRKDDALGGICAKGIVKTNHPVMLEPGQKWTVTCEAETLPPAGATFRMSVHMTLETPEGESTLNASRRLDEAEVVPVCRAPRQGEPGYSDSSGEEPK
jgi:hypothetical protein